jgi:hypothetical protein
VKHARTLSIYLRRYFKDVDAADDPLGETAEVGREMEEQIDAGGEQKDAAQRPLDRNHANHEPCARRVAGAHRES